MKPMPSSDLTRAAVLSLGLSLGAASSAMGQVVREWTNPAGGDWSPSTNWNPLNTPFGPAEAALLPSFGSPYTVRWDYASGSIAGLEIGSDAELLIDPELMLSLQAQTLANDGLIMLGVEPGPNQGPGFTRLLFAQDTTLTGSGTIRLGGEYAWLNSFAPKMLTNDAGHVIEGSGTLFGSIVNNGTIRASGIGATLMIDEPIVNNGTLGAFGPGTVLTTGTFSAGELIQNGDLVVGPDAEILFPSEATFGPDARIRLQGGTVRGHVDLGDMATGQRLIAQPGGFIRSIRGIGSREDKRVFATNYRPVEGVMIDHLFATGVIETDEPLNLIDALESADPENPVVLRSSVPLELPRLIGVRNESSAAITLRPGPLTTTFRWINTTGVINTGHLIVAEGFAGVSSNSGLVEVMPSGRAVVTQSAEGTVRAGVEPGPNGAPLGPSELRITGGSFEVGAFGGSGVALAKLDLFDVFVDEAEILTEDLDLAGSSIGGADGAFVNEANISFGQLEIAAPLGDDGTRKALRLEGTGMLTPIDVRVTNFSVPKARLSLGGSLINGPAHTLRLHGPCIGRWVNEGTMSAASLDRTDRLHVDSDATTDGELVLMAGSVFELKLDRYSSDRIEVASLLELDGILRLRPLPGDPILAGTVHTIFQADTPIRGRFDGVDSSAIAPLVGVVAYSENSVTLRIVDPTGCSFDLTSTGALAAGDLGFGAPDGTLDGTDLSFFVERFLEASPLADFTTTNTNPGQGQYGVSDGVVDGADLGYYVEGWLTGCP